MTSEDKTKVQYVREFTKFGILASILMAIVFGLVGGSFYVLLVLTTYPTVVGNIAIFLTLWLSFPTLLGIVAWLRNRILKWLFGKLTYDGVHQFAVFWNFVPFLAVFLLLWGSLNAFRDPAAFLSFVGFSFLLMALYFIFERPLSNEGAIQIWFGGLFSSLNNFRTRQYYWKRISKIVENSLRTGNIQASSDDLMYNLNKRFLETNEDFSNDLRSIQEWLLGRQRSCLDSIKRIFPEFEIRQYTKDSFLKRFFKQVLENPTETQADIIKRILWFVFFAFLVVIVLLVRPDLLGELLKGLGLG